MIGKNIKHGLNKMKINDLRANGNILSYTVHFTNKLKETYVQYILISHTCHNTIFLDITRYLCKLNIYLVVLYYQILNSN